MGLTLLQCLNFICTVVTCVSQTTPPNSIKSGCSSSTDATETYGTECSFYCMNGYEAETSDDGRSRCLADGTWSGTDLVCTGRSGENKFSCFSAYS